MTAPETWQKSGSPLKEAVILALACVAALFILAFIAGLVTAGIDSEGGPSYAYYLALAATVLVFIAIIRVIWRRRPSLRLPSSPRMRASRVVLYACLSLSVAVGIGLSFAEGPAATDLSTLFSSAAPISPTAAVILTFGMLVTTALSARWHMLLDEHERLAYDFGAVAALYTYLTVSICWWLLARGGLVSPPDGFIIFWLVMFVWMIGWIIRRYR